METASAQAPLWEPYGPPPDHSLYHWPLSTDDRQLQLGDDPQQVGPSDMEQGFMTWDRTPDLGSMQQFGSFPSAMSPYTSFSPYVPSHPEFQQSFAALPLGRQHSSLSSSASSSSLASSHDRHSPLECSTSHSSSSSLYLSGTLGFTPATVPRAAPCVNPSPKVESPATDLKPASFVASPASGSVEPTLTAKSDEDHHDFFDHLFKKPVGLGFAESRLRQASLGGTGPPSALDMSRNPNSVKSEGPLSAPPLLSPSPIHPRGVRPALLARQHSLHGVDSRARSDSTFSTSSFDSNASLGLGSPLGALALIDPASPALVSSQLQQQQPVRTVHPLAISAGPGSPGILAPPMVASVSLSAIQSPGSAYRSTATTNGQVAPLTPRLRELQQTDLPADLPDSSESRRPRSSSNPSGGRSARGRHSRNGSVVLAAGGRQLQTLAALKGALEDESSEAGNAGGVQRRRSVRGAAAEARSGMRTPPVGTASVFDVATPGGTVKARKTERRSGLMESVMARGSPATADGALAAATVSTNATPTPQIAPPPPLALAGPPGPPSTASAVAVEGTVSSRRRSSTDEALSLLMDEDGEIETDADGRLICGMLLPGMTEPCRRAFKRKEHRKRHQRQHTNEKPYPCPKCGMRFTRTDNCNQHIRTHENKDGRNSKMLRERQEREARGHDYSPAVPGQHPTPDPSIEGSPMLSYPTHQPMPVLSGPMPEPLEGYYGLGMDQGVWMAAEAVHPAAAGFYA